MIATGMAKDPGARYPTTVQLARAARGAITEPLRGQADLSAQPRRRAPMPMPMHPQQPPTPRPSHSNSGSDWSPPPPARPFIERPPAPSASPPMSPPAPAARRSRRWIVPTAIGAVTAVVGGSAIWLTTRPSTTPPISSTAPTASTTPPISPTTPPPSRPSTSAAGKRSAASKRMSAPMAGRSFSTRATPPRTGRRCGRVSSHPDRHNAVPTS